jgi:CHRD domain
MKYILFAALAAIAVTANAQDAYKVRLRPVPMDNAMARTMAGSGQATATLTGTKLAISGTFEGLAGAATVAKIHQGARMGVRGNPILDLTVAKSPAGALTGTVDLTPAQVEALKAGKLYIQIAAEKAPEGNLWGWLAK